MEPLDISHGEALDISNQGLGGGGATSAAQLTYSNAVSGLAATNAQAAIDEVYAAMQAADTQLQGGIDALDASKPNRNGNITRPYLSTDFMVATGSNAVDPFIGVAVVSGTTNQPNVVDENHPGVLRILSSTSANSGYFIGTNTAQIRLAGGEALDVIFYIDTLAGTTARFGFFDSATIANPTDAAMIEVDSSGVATGKTFSNTVTSSTGTTGSLSQATWYRARIELNANATQVTFTIYNMSGGVVWSASLTTNIPTGAGRETGAGAIMTNSGTSAITLGHLDFMALDFGRVLTRGA